ncbi:MAG: hypothetical protein U0136_15585 [Bdellovibrionota bacterium]
MKCRLLLLLLVVLSLVSCSSREELAFSFDANDAIEAMTLLQNAGISADARKEGSGREERYRISVSRTDKDAVVRLLHDYQLPRKREDDFNSLTTSDGFVPNLREISQLRMDRALAVEIEGQLRGLEGVKEVHAIIRSHLIPEDQNGSVVGEPGKKVSPSASIVLRFTSRSGNQPFTTDEVKRTVAKAVPGLATEDVSVSATRIVSSGPGDSTVDEAGAVPLAAVAPFAFRVPAQDRDKVRVLIAGLLVLFVVAGFVIGFYMSRWLRPARAQRVPPKAVRTAMLEASFRTASGTTTPSVPPKPGGSPPRSTAES